MLIAILAGAVCIIITILLFAPMFRHALLFRPVALFFLFEGIWIMFDYLVSQLWPGIEAMQWVHYAGVIIFGGYLMICLIYSRPKKEKSKRKSSRNKRRARRTTTE